MSHPTKTLAVASQKGGVGKSATATESAAALAQLGKRVLLIDIDPQGHGSKRAGCETVKSSGTYHVLCDEAPIADAAKPSPFGFDVLTSCLDLVDAHDRIGSQPGGHFILRRAIEASAGRYDSVLIDCPPGLGHLTMAAFVAASTVLVPTDLMAESVDGLGKLHDTISKLQRRIGLGVRVGGVLVIKDDRRSDHAKDVYAELEAKAGGLLLRGTVRFNTMIAKAFDRSSPIIHYAPRAKGAIDYCAVARELLERGLV